MLDEVIASTNSKNFKLEIYAIICVVGARIALNFHRYEYEHDKL